MTNFMNQVLNTRPGRPQVDHAASSRAIFNAFYNTCRKPEIEEANIGDVVKSCQYPVEGTGYIIGQVVEKHVSFVDDTIHIEYVLEKNATDEEGYEYKTRQRTIVDPNFPRGDFICMASADCKAWHHANDDRVDFICPEPND